MLVEEIGIQCMKEGIAVITEYFYKTSKLNNSILNNSNSMLDGVVVFYEEDNDVRIAKLKQQEIPFVVFEKPNIPNIPYIGNDNRSIMFETYDHLCKNGLENTLLLLRKPTLVNKDRVIGVYNAFENNNIPLKNVSVQYDIRTADDTYNYLIKHLDGDYLPDLIFISGDERVLGAYKALQELNLSIPEDVSILGFDNIPMGKHFSPPLSTIKPDYEALSKEIVHALNVLNDQGAYISELINPSLNIRSSINEKYIKPQKNDELKI